LFEGWAADYAADGFVAVIDSDDSIADTKAYFQSKNLNNLTCYGRGDISMDNLWTTTFAYANAGSEGGSPKTIVLDRDGNIRFFAYGAIDGSEAYWGPALKVIKHCTGAM